MTIESANRGALVGRLFNRAALSRAKRFDDPYERPWFAQETTSGGGFSPHSGEIHTSPKSVLGKVSEGNKKRRENRIDYESNRIKKKHYFEDDRERFEEGLDRRTSEPSILTTIEPKAISSHRKKNQLLNYPNNVKTSPTKKSQPKTGLIAIKSAMAKGKRPRQCRNKVAFAGEQILLEKSHQTDFVLHCEFVDLVKVLYISHFSEYTKEIFDSLWYTRDEIDQMKSEHFYWKRMSSRRKGERRTSIGRKLSNEGRSHNLRHLRHKKTVAIVFREQERQRSMCRKIYGRIVDASGKQRSGSCIIDRERLKDVYRRAGNTLKRQQEAIERASVNHHLDVYFSKIRNESVDYQQHEVTSTNIYKQQEQYQQQEDPLVIEEWSSMEASYSKFCLKISASFRDSIGCVFFTLLAPFLEQRRESSLFLEIGEEMIVASY
uniref:Uncharacterized protein n=1 Tax=Pseudo-nitzschia arenysensis TaxID=697910 RepID=A0A7R9ZU65_9STRA|mmetsp:Transcript_618/g.1470  ORF Transcript_618/g.1470 Transcript_618/m.1470 type:complete len:434 (+) Transcript_618:72-1373(+)